MLTLPQLAEEWDKFAQRDRLTRVAASLGALAWMDYGYAPGSRASDPGGDFEPIPFPIGGSKDDLPLGIDGWSVDPRIRDGWFWRTERTTVRDSTGKYTLTPDGNLKPENS
jgi:hypothetical protein